MKNTKRYITKVKNAGKIMLAMLTVCSCMILFSFESLAAEGTVKTTSAKIRSEANTSSEVLASVEAGDELMIKAKTTGADGYTWYQVFVDADTLGFIRSDLVEADGTVPEMQASSSQSTTSDSGSSTETTNQQAQAVTITVEPMESQSATITGGDVNVRQSASTSTAKVATAKNGTAITVTGQATGADGKVWYQATFINDGTEITGFIRSDYVELGAVIEETPAETEENAAETEVTEDSAQTTQTESKAYDTVLETKEDGTQEWYLYDNAAGYKYSIPDLMAVTQNNSEADGELEGQVKQQKIIIIVLIVILVVVILGATLLFFKLHDNDDFDEEDEEEEEIPVRKRKVERTVREPAREPVKRPAQTTDRPVRRQTQGTTARTQQTQRPVRQTEAASQRPVQKPVQKPRPTAQMLEKEVTYEEDLKLDTKRNSNNQWRSKNFLADDDEFEFEFLNMDDPKRL